MARTANGQGSRLELRILPNETAGDAEVRLLLADGKTDPSSLDNGSPGSFDPQILPEPFALKARADAAGVTLTFPALVGENYTSGILRRSGPPRLARPRANRRLAKHPGQRFRPSRVATASVLSAPLAALIRN